MKNAGWAVRLASVATFPLLVLPAPSAFADSAPAVFVLPARGPMAMHVSGAAQNAITKLERPECRMVLADFRDAEGRLLKDNLESRRMSAPEFLASLVFVDGAHVSLCGRPEVAAGTNPGQSVIAVCVPTFARIRQGDPGLAANVLIHEMLHSLGLGERPDQSDAPTSQEITRQVVRRCGP